MCLTVSKVVNVLDHTSAFTSVYTTSITLSVNPSAVKKLSFIYNPLAARMQILLLLLLLKGYSYP